eukprot:761691-Hanusia_phi.AAC.1
MTTLAVRKRHAGSLRGEGSANVRREEQREEGKKVFGGPKGSNRKGKISRYLLPALPLPQPKFSNWSPRDGRDRQSQWSWSRMMVATA